MPVRDPDAPAEKGDHIRVPSPHSSYATNTTLTPKLEDAGVFQEELPFLGKKETESSQVDLLIVGFHLGKIGVQRQIQRQLGTDSIFDVKAHLGFEIDVISFQPHHRSRER